MTIKFFALFLTIILSGAKLISAQPSQCVECIDPAGTPIPTCTPTPEPSNPRKYVAGSNGLLETNSVGGYNWAPMVAPGNGYERLPMYRDWDDLTEQGLAQITISNTVAAIGGNSDWLLTFNEPDLPPPAGSAMTVDQVVAGLALIEAMYPDKLIVSPAYSQYNYTRLETDYETFYSTYGRYPRWDAIAYHCYFIGTASTCMPVLNWMVAFADRIEADTGTRPDLWNTEFAALATTGSAGPNWQEAVAAAIAYIDAMETLGVDRYFWFSHCDEAMPYYECALAYDDGSLTPLGEMYRSR